MDADTAKAALTILPAPQNPALQDAFGMFTTTLDRLGYIPTTSDVYVLPGDSVVLQVETNPPFGGARVTMRETETGLNRWQVNLGPDVPIHAVLGFLAFSQVGGKFGD